MYGKHISKQRTYVRIRSLLGKVPGQSVKELADKLGDNRTAVSGYLRALEDLGYVTSRRVGPAKVYHNARTVEEV